MSAAKKIVKSIEINATSQQVWQVLFSDEYYPQWAGTFAPGSIAKTDWQEGSSVLFSDGSTNGLIGHIITSDKPNLLEIKYDGEAINGELATDSPMTNEMKNMTETYRLEQTDGITLLLIASDMGEDYFDEMSQKWDIALEIIKSLAEKL